MTKSNFLHVILFLGIFIISPIGAVFFYSYSNASATTDPTVSASPPGGTYNAVQSVTLTASTPSTIYYTTDSSVPSTSSPNGPSPVTIIVNTNSTLKYFAKDNSGNIGPTGSSSYTITIPTVTPMNDTSGISGLSVYSGRQLQTEYITSSSVLNGKSIDTITVFLKKIGAPAGTVQVGVFNSDQSVKQLFGTKDASTVATSYTQYTFSLTAPQIYKIQSGDRIGVKFTGGDATNYLAIQIDQDPADPFDGTNSFLTYYTTGWQVFTANDLNMVLKLHLYGTGPTVSASPGPGTYGSAQSVTLAASAPSTIYYTIDGSVPTVSSTNGPSPVSGIIINTNSTLKFFAKDSSGNTGPVVTAGYTIIPPPTVSASPGPGTYNSAQSVTLTASRSGTIYYTTDGSVPTVSSTNGPSPVSGIIINTNSTLKFFAKDNFGISGSISSAVYTIISPLTVTASPPGGTYNSAQSVNLTASAPSTIYYTTDGSVPTVSSPNGP